MFYLCSIVNIQAQSKVVYSFSIHQEIGPAVTRLTEKAIAEAEAVNAEYLLIDLDTYGGLVDDADKIRTALLKTRIPTLAFIRNNAASAGALISIACDSIYMRPGATIGAASVVNQTGELMPEKYQSYMRKKMRATAEETGRNPLIAEGMTDENLEIDSIKEKGKIVTLTTQEAIRFGYCNASVESPEEVLQHLSGKPLVIQQHCVSWIEEVIMWLVNPAVSGLLLLIIFGGIYFEFKAPGTMLPMLISALAAVLYFAPLYLEGLAANWEILLFVLGVILIVLEIFVIPGFGITGISGIVLVILSLTLALVRNVDFDFSYVPSGSLSTAFLMVSVALAVPLAILLAFGGKIFASSIFKRAGVMAEMTSSDGFTAVDNSLAGYIGKEGITTTDLRPSGKAAFSSHRLDVMTEGTFINKGTTVVATKVQGNLLVVEKV